METYIIAEVGPNHNGQLELAKELVNKLATIGVDAIKFQLSDPTKSMSKDAFKANYQKHNDNAEDVLEASKKRQLSRAEHAQLAEMCKTLGVDYLCTAFDIDSLTFLDEELNIPRFKIGSGEIFALDCLEYMANSKKPIILSTGMASYDEISQSYTFLKDAGAKDITILHCVSNYPAPIEDINLSCMHVLREMFQCNIGFSDHTLGNDAPLAAVALGASVIEKHVTLDKSLPGPDHKASSTVDEFELLVKSIRTVEKAIGMPIKQFSKDELEIKNVARKSLVSKRAIKKGEALTASDVCFKRPGTGINPLDLDKVIGKEALQDIEEDRLLSVDYFK